MVFFMPFISMGVLYSISIDYFKLSREKYAEVFTTGLIIPVVLSLILIPLLYFFRSPLHNAFSFQDNFFWLIPVSIFFNFCFEAFLLLLRNQQHVKMFTVVSILKILLEIGLSVFLVIFIYKNWYSRALGITVALTVIGVIFFYYIRHHKFLIGKINYTVLKSELYFGLSGLVLQSAVFFVNTSDKFFVMSFFGKDQAGYYSVAATFATIQFIVCTALLQYLQPVLFKEFAAMQTWTTVKSLYYKYFLGMLVTLLGVICFTLFVYHFILRSAYKEYVHYFYVLSISTFIWTISNIFLQYIVFNKSKKIIVLLSLTTIAFSLVVNYIASKYLGINWLILGQIVTNVFVLLLVLYFNRKLKYFA